MTKRQTSILIFLLGLLMGFMSPSLADENVSVACTSPTVSVAPGETALASVTCVITAPDAGSSYRITDSNNNFMSPATVSLNRGLTVLTGSLQPVVTSPDNSVTSISGTSSGFTARFSSSSAPKTLLFQYSISTNSSALAGLYSSSSTPANFRYQVCTNPSCSQQVFSGMATASLSVDVATIPMAVSCASPTVNATPGGGPFNLDVVCTLSGGNTDKISPGGHNLFSPSTITLTGSSAQLTATLQPTVTSPDSSVSSIIGTAGSGFTGSISAMPAKIQIRYTGNTTSTTPAGAYTSAPVLFTWSTI